MRRGLILCLGLLLIAACSSNGPFECKSQNCLLSKKEANPSRSLEFWQSRLQKPLDQRLDRIPEELLEYIRLDNRLNGYPASVTRFEDREAVALLRQAFASLPTRVHDLVRSKLAGIFLVDNLGTSGYTESIRDQTGKPVAGILVLMVFKPDF